MLFRSRLIDGNQCFVYPVTWGGGDSMELKKEFKDRQVGFPFFGRRWIDVKTWYTLHKIAKGQKPNGGLKSAMAEYKLKFIGTPHRADDDAFNTLRVFFKIIDNQIKVNTILDEAKEIQ